MTRVEMMWDVYERLILPRVAANVPPEELKKEAENIFAAAAAVSSWFFENVDMFEKRVQDNQIAAAVLSPAVSPGWGTADIPAMDLAQSVQQSEESSQTSEESTEQPSQ